MLMTFPKRIGIDFDNTIVGYDEAFLAAAKKRGLISENFRGSKQAIRDAIRLLPEGEQAWQLLQGFIYGQGMAEAVMFDGVGAFLLRCQEEGHVVHIVSHKTEYGHFDPARVNLRQAALDWMDRQGFFREDKYGVPIANVHFESTRADKLDRIAALGCTHFIDDLEEVLGDPGFPRDIERILFSREAVQKVLPYTVFSTWSQIEEALFDALA
ncbi:MAG: hypothetical protein ACLQAT_27900 [Candidatus Binataceae bacterium]